MTRSELEALKEKARSRKEKASDMDILAGRLFGLLRGIAALLPEEVKAVLKKYGYEE